MNPGAGLNPEAAEIRAAKITTAKERMYDYEGNHEDRSYDQTEIL
jgi:hypothetical protein